MFRQEKCTVELSEKFGRYYPEFMLPIRFEVEARLPLTPLKLYSYTVGKTENYYGVRMPKGMMSEIIVGCLGFKIFLKEAQILKDRKMWLFGGDEQFANVVLPYLQSINWNYDIGSGIDQIFYISREQEKLLLNSSSLPLPDGYTLGSATVDDAETITKTWKYNLPGEEEHTKAFPSSCVRFNGKPVAFEVVHPSAMLNHLFVFSEHRGKGLGHIVEQDLCRKLIREGFPVYKCVETYNTSVMKGTVESPYWTMKKKVDGTPLQRKFIAFWPNKEE